MNAKNYCFNEEETEKVCFGYSRDWVENGLRPALRRVWGCWLIRSST